MSKCVEQDDGMVGRLWANPVLWLGAGKHVIVCKILQVEGK